MTCHGITISVPFNMLMELPNSPRMHCDMSTLPCRSNASFCRLQCTVLYGFSDIVKAAILVPYMMATSPISPSSSIED